MRRSLLISVISLAVGVGIYAFIQRRANNQPTEDDTGPSNLSLTLG
jgi:hypothetical protein